MTSGDIFQTSESRDTGHWRHGDSPRGPGHRLTLGCLSAGIFTHLEREIVVFVSEGSVTAARLDEFGICLVSFVIQLIIC